MPQVHGSLLLSALHWLEALLNQKIDSSKKFPARNLGQIHTCFIPASAQANFPMRRLGIWLECAELASLHSNKGCMRLNSVLQPNRWIQTCAPEKLRCCPTRKCMICSHERGVFVRGCTRAPACRRLGLLDT